MRKNLQKKEEERKKRDAEKPAPPHRVLLSIHPEYAEAILAGTKKFEFRKRIFSDSVESILLYATSPVKKVLGEAKVANLVSGKPGKVWKKTEAHAGISREDFFAYFKNASEAHAYELTDVAQYEEPKALADFGVKRAPQSFVYVREETEKKKD
jgi:predicted transcriptional regulator